MLLVINPVLLYHYFSVNGQRGCCVLGAENLSVFLRTERSFVLALTENFPNDLKEDFVRIHKLNNLSTAITLPSYPGQWGTERAINLLLSRGVFEGHDNWVALDLNSHGYHPESAYRVLQCDPHLGFGLQIMARLKKLSRINWDPYRPPVAKEWREGVLEGHDWNTLLQHCEKSSETTDHMQHYRFDNYLWNRLVLETGVRDEDYCADTTMIDVSLVPAIFKPKLKSYLVKNPEHLMSTPEHQDGLATLESLHHVFFRQVLGRLHRGEEPADIWRD